MSSEDPTVIERLGEERWGDACVGSGDQGKLWAREKLLSTPTTPSTHCLLVLCFSQLSDGYQSLGKCRRGEVHTELIFTSFLRGGEVQRPLC